MNDTVYIIYFKFQHTYSSEFQLQNFKYIHYKHTAFNNHMPVGFPTVKEATKLVIRVF
jgi:hypothetical protein